MTIDVTLLGTGSPLPSPDRAGPSTLVQAGGQTFLFDAGRGLGMRLTAAGVVAPMLTTVFLTHLHSDHITDLNDLITGRWVTGFPASPLPIYGPPGTRRVVDAIVDMLGPDIGYRIGKPERIAHAGTFLEQCRHQRAETGLAGHTGVAAVTTVTALAAAGRRAVRA